VQPPRRQRRLALIVLLAAAALAIAAFPVRHTWWGGWILAIAEAGIVGGLADWFAVTAIFRRPLGLPIPHTALIPSNWQLMAARVGAMVGGQVLTREYVMREIGRLDIAAWLATAADRVKPADIEAAVATATRWAAGEVPAGSATGLVAWFRSLLRERPVAPLIAEVLDVAHRHGWDERLISALARILAGALDRPGFREAFGAILDDVVGSYRRRMGGYPGFLIGLANFLGLIDRNRLMAALQGALMKVADDPADPLRQHVSALIAELPERLRTSSELAARVEAAKDELLDSPALTSLLEDAAAGLQRELFADLRAEPSHVVAWVADQIERARRTLISDEAVRARMSEWIKAQAAKLVEAYHGQVAAFIERGVRALGPEGAVRLIEDHAGDDLQYIRVNGTVVGGLAGGAIYGVHRLIALF